MSLVDRDDNNKEIHAPSLEYSVKIQLPHPFVNMDNLQVFHGEEAVSGAVYDKATRTISFTTTGFSPFTLKYIDYTDPTFELDYAEQNGQYTIKKGMFIVKNPVEYDGNLQYKEHTHMVLNFVEDNTAYYSVSERATTVIVAADDAADDVFLAERDADYYDGLIKTKQSGVLYKVISDMQGNNFSTIYILPGTYNEATALRVYSNMLIMGIGKTDDIRIIKGQAKGNSNRHIFNVCNKDGAQEYIHVTIRNLYLDATVYNYASKPTFATISNSAVQAINLVKVKCYDLIVEKKSADAFYVNANNKAGAFMYVQDTTVNNTLDIEPQGIKAPYKFYYYNITANGSPYVETKHQDITPIVNTKMNCSDWIWD